LQPVFHAFAEAMMVVRCPICSRANPPEAYYCYFDGGALSKGQTGPLQIGTLPFTRKFFFADGHSCGNFNELALACNSHWDEAKGLLSEDFWPNFFRSMGRLDLAEVARLAGLEPNRDFGMAKLLEKLPADPGAVRPPKLAIEEPGFDFGRLTPRSQGAFDLTIFNQGMFLLHGAVSTDCNWIAFGDNEPSSSVTFRTRQSCTIPVRLVSDNLRASARPMTGEIVLRTNGGTATIPVQAVIPITPFPKIDGNGSLAGATSPREIAERAMKMPQEAGLLFAQSAVRDWYESNGWAYPVEFPTGSGKATVQQYFEALGLTKPPVLEVDTDSIEASGAPGEHLGKSIVLSTRESKPVYAQVATDQDWLQVAPIKSSGNRLKIPVRIDVPANPGKTLIGVVVIQGNGRQRFRIPVTLTVTGFGSARVPVPTQIPATSRATMVGEPLLETPPLGEFDVGPPSLEPPALEPAASYPRGNPFRSPFALLALSLVVVVALGLGAAAWMTQPSTPTPEQSVLVAQHQNLVFADTVFLMNVNLAALRDAPRLAGPCRMVEASLSTMLDDLHLETGLRIDSIAVSHRANGAYVIAWSFSKPANLENAISGRFSKIGGGDVVLLQDRFDPEHGWAVDEQGRLLSGPLESIRSALRPGAPGPNFARLSQAAREIPERSPFWLVADLSRGPGAAPPSWLKDLADVTRAAEFNVFARMGDDVALEGRFAFPNPADAVTVPERSKNFEYSKLPAFGPDIQPQEFVVKTTWKYRDKQGQSNTTITANFLTELSIGVKHGFDESNQRIAKATKDVIDNGFASAQKALDEGRHRESIEELQRLSSDFPKSAEIGGRMASANGYVKKIEELRQELARDPGSFDPAKAQKLFDDSQKANRNDTTLVALEQLLSSKTNDFNAKRGTREAQSALDKGDYPAAAKLYQAAAKLRPNDKAIQSRAECSLKLADIKAALVDIAGLDRIDDRAGLWTLAHKSAPLFLPESPAGWPEAALRKMRDDMRARYVDVLQGLRKKHQGAVATQRSEAAVLVSEGKDWDAAIEKLNGAQTELTRIQEVGDLLVKVADSIDNRTQLEKNRAALDATVGEILATRSKKASALASLVVEGADAKFKEARRDPKLIAPALVQLSKTLADLNEFADTKVDPARKIKVTTQSLIEKFELLRAPATLDFSKGAKIPDNWPGAKDGWAVGQNRWIQSKLGKEGASMKSRRTPWPDEFDLELDFAMVTVDGKINNELWKNNSKPDLMFITVADYLGPVAEMKFGTHVEEIGGERSVALTTANGSTKLKLPNDPINLRLRRRANTIAIEINGQTIQSINADRSCDELRIVLNNAPRLLRPGEYEGYPAIFGLSVRPKRK
jgi:hypothetical protein